MNAATLFSGIGASETAMPHWRWLWCAEIEKFPSAVLAARHPGSINLGDVSADDFADRAAAIGRPDVLVFGSPCQSFSVAGKRLGLDDPRGNLAIVALGVVGKLRPRWFVFENVPGLLSSGGGRDFGVFLGLVGELGYGFAYRVLDAQYFGVAQRRRRVFVVGHLGDWRRAAAVLFEPEGLRGDPAPCRETGERAAPTIASRPTGGGGLGTDFDCDGGLIAHALRGEGFDASEDGTGRGTPLIASTEVARTLMAKHTRHDPELESYAIQERAICGPDGAGWRGDGAAYTLEARTVPQAIAFTAKDYGADAQDDLSPTLRAGGHTTSHANAGVMPAVALPLGTRVDRGGSHREAEGNNLIVGPLRSNNRNNSNPVSEAKMHVRFGSAVRRLTPRECELLQGYNGEHTAIIYRGKPAADGPRYKSIGNSKAVPVVRWILSRIELADSIELTPG